MWQGLIHIKNGINNSKVTCHNLRAVNVILAVGTLDPITVIFRHRYNRKSTYNIDLLPCHTGTTMGM